MPPIFRGFGGRRRDEVDPFADPAGSLPRQADMHCVTKWSKLDTRWKDVSVDTLFDGVETEADWVTAIADGD